MSNGKVTQRDERHRTWRFCASVAQAHRIVEWAQVLRATVELTTIRDGRDGPHAACAWSQSTEVDDSGIDGYEVSVSCAASPEVVAKVWPAIAPAARGCIALLA